MGDGPLRMALVTIRIDGVSSAIVTGILTRVRPDLLPVLGQPEPDRGDVLAVLDAVGNELASYGFDESGNPTAYGLLLEGIVDEINRIGFQ